MDSGGGDIYRADRQHDVCIVAFNGEFWVGGASKRRADIRRVIEYAEAHPYNLHDLFAVIKGTRPPPGNIPEFVCVIPVGYRCVFTFEQQPKGLCRHLSVSVLGDGQAPSPGAMFAIAKEFGFIGGAYQLDKEDIGHGKIAVNAWQLIEPKP